jgi:hypothetical protein
MTAGILLAFSPLFAIIGFWSVVYGVLNLIFSQGQRGLGDVDKERA